MCALLNSTNSTEFNKQSAKINLTYLALYLRVGTGADPGFALGVQTIFPIFADTVLCQSGSEGNTHQQGSRAHLGALESLAFLSVKYAFLPLFLVPFLQNVQLIIYLGT